jgi:tRNA-binding EMAP/Myf-like protein
MVDPMSPAPVKPPVSMAEVEKLDVRVGTIRAVEDVPGSKKLVRLRVDFGDHIRVILVGMKGERDDPAKDTIAVAESCPWPGRPAAGRFDPREIEGLQALFVVNLEPKRMAGEVSEGMLFDLGYADGIKPVLAVPERPVPDGSRAG